MGRPSRARPLPAAQGLKEELQTLIRQLHRGELDPVASARLCLRLIGPPFNRTAASIARAARKNRSTIGRWLALLQLPAEIQDMIAQGRLTERHTRTLEHLADPTAQLALARRAVKEDWTAERLEEEAAGRKGQRPPSQEKLAETFWKERAAIERRTGAKAGGAEGDVVNARLPANAEEERALEALALQGPEPFYAWVYGPRHPITLTVKGKTWPQMGVENPRFAARKFIETFRLLKQVQEKGETPT